MPESSWSLLHLCQAAKSRQQSGISVHNCLTSHSPGQLGRIDKYKTLENKALKKVPIVLMWVKCLVMLLYKNKKWPCTSLIKKRSNYQCWYLFVVLAVFSFLNMFVKINSNVLCVPANMNDENPEEEGSRAGVEKEQEKKKKLLEGRKGGPIILLLKPL